MQGPGIVYARIIADALVSFYVSVRFWWTHEDIGQLLYSLQGLRPIAAQVRQLRELGFPRWRIVQHRRPIVVRGRLLELRCRARPHLPSVTHPAQHPGSMSVCGLYIIYKSVCSMQQDIKFGFRCPKLQNRCARQKILLFFSLLLLSLLRSKRYGKHNTSTNPCGPWRHGRRDGSVDGRLRPIRRKQKPQLAGAAIKSCAAQSQQPSADGLRVTGQP